MSGFGKYTHNYSTRLKDTPWYRKGAKGPDPLTLFTAEANRNYARNTDQLRDMRFARSNEMSRDSAVRSRRDSKMSQMSYANARDPRELAGLHARVVARGTRAMGAESDGKTYLSVRKRWGGLGRGAAVGGGGGRGPGVPRAAGGNDPAPAARAPAARAAPMNHQAPAAVNPLAARAPPGGSGGGATGASSAPAWRSSSKARRDQQQLRVGRVAARQKQSKNTRV